ncbi:MAG: hypothetical protein J3K34DRAFT_427401 [Monoraphidium minutum]|nr:MAG: hypothetical protein J3K34DRAFT_427401 [Monoraphidium minutum]
MQELGIDGLVFSRYEEAKETHGSKKFHKFFLVDAAGNRHLAATGEDTGDAHYNYTSSKPFAKFGAVSCHNRQKVLQWLESIIVETGGNEGAVVEATDSDAHERVYFVEHRRGHLHDLSL